MEVLSDIVQRTFFSVFGERHLSIKCIIYSAVFSIFALLLTFIISIIWRFDDFLKIGPGWTKLLVALQASPNANVKHAAVWLAHIPPYILVITLSLIWLFWCLLPDYLALLKIRIMLTVLKYTKPGVTTLIFTLIIDFVIGIWTFLASFAVVQALISVFLLIDYNYSQITGFFSALVSFFIVGGVLFVFESALFVFTAAIFFFVPIANLFWASMIPSIWLWAYVFTALVTRAALISKPAFVKFLNISDHPFRSVGVIAGLWIAFLSFAMLAVLSVV